MDVWKIPRIPAWPLDNGFLMEVQKLGPHQKTMIRTFYERCGVTDQRFVIPCQTEKIQVLFGL